ncbi:O-antigen ligase family protein [Bradyrhizobium roseum]|uniref:O-antigen ligase family protein n=1 Tax=Bradyrhizobium roseum TaxID=3056648 RepID=UPI0026137933|nr:O-antigen ligase family protein [Bradyrhizobium roseus]WKA26970.1 O-antigen ligase family protein [Bradyrhizobium roseus]
MVVWLICLFPTINLRSFCRSLKQPASYLPLALLALALLGLFWADDTWGVRLEGIAPVAKLAVIPLLLYHFERSHRAHWVFIAFLGSCTILMGLSWIVYFAPSWRISGNEAGVPVRNSIDQTQAFAICVCALAPILLAFFAKRRTLLAFGCSALLIGFVVNMAFIALARTAFLYLPFLAAIFAARYLSGKAALKFFVIVAGAAVLAAFTSPYLRHRLLQTAVEFKQNDQSDIATSTGQRLLYWSNSLDSIARAPILGHGTGSTKQLFERLAEGKSGPWADKIRNPHNQTLYVAIQWGLFGCIILFSMWGAHLLLFRGHGLIEWIGLSVVAQNFLSGFANSHLFDFHAGWLYVLGVGVAGAIVCRESTSPTVRHAT